MEIQIQCTQCEKYIPLYSAIWGHIPTDSKWKQKNPYCSNCWNGEPYCDEENEIFKVMVEIGSDAWEPEKQNDMMLKLLIEYKRYLKKDIEELEAKKEELKNGIDKSIELINKEKFINILAEEHTRQCFEILNSENDKIKQNEHYKIAVCLHELMEKVKYDE